MFLTASPLATATSVLTALAAARTLYAMLRGPQISTVVSAALASSHGDTAPTHTFGKHVFPPPPQLRRRTQANGASLSDATGAPCTVEGVRTQAGGAETKPPPLLPGKPSRLSMPQKASPAAAPVSRASFAGGTEQRACPEPALHPVAPVPVAEVARARPLSKRRLARIRATFETPATYAPQQSLTPAPLSRAASVARGARIGRLVLGRVLGSGSRATVFTAHNVLTGRSVAAKVMPLAAAAGLRREQRALHLVAPHAHVVQAHSLFENDLHAALSLDLLPGPSLLDVVRGEGILSEQTARPLFAGVAAALAACHAAGVAHRDVKLDNILLSGAGGPAGSPAVLCGFGLALVFQRQQKLTTRAARAGSEAYVAPELHGIGETLFDAGKADVFSLGVAIYAATHGKFPYEWREDDGGRIVGGRFRGFATRTCSHRLVRLLVGMLDCNAKKRLDSAAVLNSPWIRNL